jgi:transposase
LAVRVADGRRLWSIEGTRSYGLGLTRYLQAWGETVCEIDLPKRTARKRGKSDRIDAERAAKEALGLPRLAIPRADGDREALRILLVTRAQLVQWRTDAINQIENLLLGLPDQLRAGFNYSGSHAWERVLKVCLELETDPQSSREEKVRLQALHDLARRSQELDRSAEVYLKQIQALVTEMAPQLLAEPGVGPLSAAVVLLAWSHRGRLHSEAAFARLAAAAPLEASSGITTRHRLSRLGDRRLNAALTTIVASRRRYDERTQLYAERRGRQAMNSKEINRCLKRFVARHLFRLLEASNHQIEH